MEKIKSLPVGKTLKYKGNTLQVVDSDRVCDACFFYKEFCRATSENTIGDCSKFFRTDHTDVIFKKI